MIAETTPTHDLRTGKVLAKMFSTKEPPTPWSSETDQGTVIKELAGRNGHAITGIALPGMPPGSPGMPGEKTEAFQIYTFSEQESRLFMSG